MKAIVHTRFGPPHEVLRLVEIDEPTPRANEIVVEVRASAVVRGDWLATHGVPYIARPSFGLRTPKQRIAGHQFAGVVAAVGDRSSQFSVGARVVGWGHGALAEYVSIPEDQVARLSAPVAFRTAAALPVSGVTALQAVRDRGAVTAEQLVLVTGASGGVGTLAVQIAKGNGAEIFGVASTPNLDFVASAGADHVVDYTTDELSQVLIEQRFDVIIDIAGNTPVSMLRRALTPTGTLVIVGGTGNKATMGFERTIGAVMLSPFVKPRLCALIAKPTSGDLDTLLRLTASGAIAPPIARDCQLAHTADAVALAGRSRTGGITVVDISHRSDHHERQQNPRPAAEAFDTDELGHAVGTNIRSASKNAEL